MKLWRWSGAMRNSRISAPRYAPTHPEDDFILAAAMAGTVDYLVTGDKQLVALGNIEGIDIVRPAEFVAILDAASEMPTR